MLEFLSQINGTHWMILAVILFVIEVATGTTYVLWVAAAAFVTALLSYILPIGWTMQLFMFSILATILLFVGHNYFAPRINKGDESHLNERAQSLIGRRVVAVADFTAGEGRVQVGDTQWRAEMKTGNAASGDELRIISVKGTILHVEAIVSEANS